MESDEKELAKYAKKRKLSTDPDCDSTDHLYDIVNDKEWISCSSSCGSENYKQGYDARRFEYTVTSIAICCICQEVLRNAQMCQENQHYFCHCCILKHLQKSPNCPMCRDSLTPETLKTPSKIVQELLAGLKISCDYKDDGCPDFIELGNLEKHVKECKFAPANETDKEIKRDEDIHSKAFCQKEIQEEKTGMEDNMARIEEKTDKIVDEIIQIKQLVNEMKQVQAQVNKTSLQAKEAVDPLKQVLAALKDGQGKIMVQSAEINIKLDEINDKAGQTKENVDQMKTIQAEIKADQVTWKAEVRQQFERVTEVLNEPRQRNNVNNNAVQAVDPGAQAHSATDQEIVILGGFYGPRGDEVSNTVEIFNVAEGNSVELPPMNTPRAESGSCVYHNDVIVAGGYDGQAGTDSIEIFRMNQRFLQWVAFEGSLPVKLSGHVIIVHQGKLFVIGGYNWNEMKTSDAIYEICLTPPYDSNLLARMPEPRTKHRVELVNGKLFIFGGMTTLSITDAINSVVVYDFITNQVQQYPSLPRPVCGMSTVTCGNMIILVGGMDENGFVLDDVIIYDTATGRKLQLPSMTHKRYGATAVIVRDVIVVFGGWNEEQGYLNTVERFAMEYGGGNEVMNERRSWATAVALP